MNCTRSKEHLFEVNKETKMNNYCIKIQCFVHSSKAGKDSSHTLTWFLSVFDFQTVKPQKKLKTKWSLTRLIFQRFSISIEKISKKPILISFNLFMDYFFGWVLLTFLRINFAKSRLWCVYFCSTHLSEFELYFRPAISYCQRFSLDINAIKLFYVSF